MVWERKRRKQYWGRANIVALTGTHEPQLHLVLELSVSKVPHLTTVALSGVVAATTGLFGYCTNLVCAEFPDMTMIEAGAFPQCSSLVHIVATKLGIMHQSAFWDTPTDQLTLWVDVAQYSDFLVTFNDVDVSDDMQFRPLAN